jgi:hypothetical protein
MDVVHGGLYLYEPPQVPRSEHDVRFVASGQEQLGLRPYIVMSRDLVKGKKLDPDELILQVGKNLGRKS